MSAQRARRAARSSPARGSAGFTLVELMVALTGGLFVSLAVFALARDTGRFYQREARLANATVSGLLGFERLRADLARAGFLASPNISKDPRRCGPTGDWPEGLRNLASIRVSIPAVSNAALKRNGRTPPVITLAGAYSSSDVYGAQVVPNGPNTNFVLSVKEGAGALRRLGNGALPTAEAMAIAFPTLRVLRIVQNGKHYYGQIAATSAGAQPTVTINTMPQVQFRSGSQIGCGLSDVVGSGASIAMINVVNFIQYAVGTPQTVSAISGYQNLFANSADGLGEAERTELTRVELDINGKVLDQTEEIVAEYAVDLNLQLIAVTSVTGLRDPNLTLLSPTDAMYSSFTGPVYNTANTPDRIRSVRVRLGVRSREADRRDLIVNPADQGLFRFNINSGPDPYARVRTFQADVALHNQAEFLW